MKIVLIVFSFADYVTVARCKQVCKLWKCLATTIVRTLVVAPGNYQTVTSLRQKFNNKGEYTTLQFALDDAKPGDRHELVLYSLTRILLLPGVHSEDHVDNMVTANGVQIVGDGNNPKKVIIRNYIRNHGSLAINVKGEVTVKNLTVVSYISSFCTTTAQTVEVIEGT